ncbi:alpha/beta fold hydrolase [Roseivivax sp. CAU 1761]
MVSYLETSDGRRLAYEVTEGRGPLIVFLPGYKSDMEGTKAVHLESWARAGGRAFLRFDYSGHGKSSGAFEEGTIGQWAADAAAVIEATARGKVVLVGSSMGGWIGCLLTRRLGPERIAGFVGIAAAPDFTEDSFWAGFDAAQRRAVMEDGQIALPSDYGEPYIVTRALIEDGRDHLVLRGPLPMPYPVRLMQGTEDEAVAGDVPLRLLAHIDGDDARLTLVKGADHRFSEPDCLSLIEAAVAEIADRA